MATKTKSKPSTEVATKTKAQVPAKMDFAKHAGSGMEGADQDSFVIPFLVVLQKLSPQVDEDSADYVKGAKPGMLFNTATKEFFPGDGSVKVVPASFQRRFIEWADRDSGGGFRGSHAVAQVDQTKLERDDSGRFRLPNGNYLSDTRYHFCVLMSKNGPQNVVLGLASTQIRKSKQWMTQMGNLRMPDAEGNLFNPPTFSHVYSLGTVLEENQKGKWYGLKIELVRPLAENESEYFNAAVEFRRLISAGAAKVDEGQRTPESTETEDDF